MPEIHPNCRKDSQGNFIIIPHRSAGGVASGTKVGTPYSSMVVENLLEVECYISAGLHCPRMQQQKKLWFQQQEHCKLQVAAVEFQASCLTSTHSSHPSLVQNLIPWP